MKRSKEKLQQAKQMYAEGYTYDEIAKELGIAKSTLSEWMDHTREGLHIEEIEVEEQADFLNRGEAVMLVRYLREIRSCIEAGNLNKALWIAEKIHASATRFLNTAKELIEEHDIEFEEWAKKFLEIAKEIGEKPEDYEIHFQEPETKQFEDEFLTTLYNSNLKKRLKMLDEFVLDFQCMFLEAQLKTNIGDVKLLKVLAKLERGLDFLHKGIRSMQTTTKKSSLLNRLLEIAREVGEKNERE